MNKQNMAACQMDPKDEIYLALRFLNKMGVSYAYLTETYHISSRTLAKILLGEERVRNNREQLFQITMKELDSIWSTNHSDIVRSIMLEAGRLHAKLPKTPQIWRFLEIEELSTLL